MTNKVIYKGLELTTLKGCKYYNVVEGCVCSIVDDPTHSVLTLTYTPGSSSWTLSELLGIPRLGRDQEMEPTYGPVRFQEVTVSLGGMVLRKMTADTHIIHIVIVSDSESRVVQNYEGTTIVVSLEDSKNPDFVEFVFYSGGLIYLKPVGPKPKCWTFANYPRIIIGNKNLVLSSENQEVYSLRRRYDDYVIRATDYLDQFLGEVRRILDGYGLELVRLNKETTLKKTSHVIYNITQTPTRELHPGRDELDSRVISYKLPIDFYLRATDMPMFFDFKSKYINVNLLTNLTEFKTGDRYGKRWTAAVKWGSITEDFNHLYQLDDNSNFSFQCQFRCELHFYEAFDTRYKFLEEIVYNIKSDNHDIVQEEAVPRTRPNA